MNQFLLLPDQAEIYTKVKMNSLRLMMSASMVTGSSMDYKKVFTEGKAAYFILNRKKNPTLHETE
ncbi:hypothetical protein ACQCT6_15890 [Cytobacillus gottheilii]